MKMKQLTILLLTALLLLSASCSKDDLTTYTIKTDYTLDTENLEIVIFEYLGDERINNNKMSNVRQREEREFTANTKAEKLKIGLVNTEFDAEVWIGTVFYLNKGENLVVELKDNTLISTQEP